MNLSRDNQTGQKVVTILKYLTQTVQPTDRRTDDLPTYMVEN